MTFPLALAVGIEGVDEVMEFGVGRDDHGRGTIAAHFAAGPAGARVPRDRSAARGEQKGQRPNRLLRSPRSSVPTESVWVERIERLLSASSWPIERARGRAAIDLRPLISELAMIDDV